MMKWLFVVLLLVCAGFFVLMQWGDEPTKGRSGPQPPLNAERIALRSSPASAPAPSSEPQPLVCMEWGEFTGEGLTRVTTALGALKLGDALSRRPVEHTIGYWVYIAPSKSQAEVDKKVARLKELNVPDYYVVHDDDKWHNAISLGMFHSQEAANSYRQTLMEQGAEGIKTGERSGKNTYTVFVLKNLNPTLSGKLTAMQRDFPDSQLQTVACGHDAK